MCRSSKFSRTMDSFPTSESDPVKNIEESVHDGCFPLFLDDDCNGSVRSPSFSNRRTSTQLIKGLTDPKIDMRESPSAAFSYIDQNSRDSGSSNMKMENDSFRPDTHRNSDAKPNDPLLDQRPMNTCSRGMFLLSLYSQLDKLMIAFEVYRLIHSRRLYGVG